MIIQPVIQQIDEWIPPSDWIQLGQVANNEILLLTSDIQPYISFRVYVLGGYTVDWGDGIINNWSTNSESSHTYTIGSGQSCSRGYSTFRVKICPQISSNNITYFSVGYPLTAQQYENGILWGKFGTTGMTSMGSAFYTSSGNKRYYSFHLECIELPYSLPSCTDYQYMAYNCISLRKIQMPFVYSSSNISFQSTFLLCISIKKINFNVSSLNVSTFQSTFQDCKSIQTINLPQTINNCSIWTSAFYNTYVLSTIILPSINTNCGCSNMFVYSYTIETIEFNNTWDGHITTLAYAFTSCYALKTLTLPNSLSLLSTVGLSGTFGACYKLPIITLPSDIPTNLTDILNIFSACYLLRAIINFPALNNASALGSVFNSCTQLTSVSNRDQLGDTTTGFDFTSTYSGARAFTTVSIRNKIIGRFVLAGSDANSITVLSSLIFTNPLPVSTWAGASPQIDVSYCSMDATALNTLFTSVIATSSTFIGKTIRITGNPGANTCDTTIITNASGTVNKTT